MFLVYECNLLAVSSRLIGALFFIASLIKIWKEAFIFIFLLEKNLYLVYGGFDYLSKGLLVLVEMFMISYQFVYWRP
jgi:hypothetical protein